MVDAEWRQDFDHAAKAAGDFFKKLHEFIRTKGVAAGEDLHNRFNLYCHVAVDVATVQVVNDKLQCSQLSELRRASIPEIISAGEKITHFVSATGVSKWADQVSSEAERVANVQEEVKLIQLVYYADRILQADCLNLKMRTDFASFFAVVTQYEDALISLGSV